MGRWDDLEGSAPQLAAFGARRLAALPAYLATVRVNGAPRVHPVTPIIAGGGLFLFMEPTSPKGRDLRERGWYALHSGVPDSLGTGGEFSVCGRGALTDDAGARAAAAMAAGYEPPERYVLFELSVLEARCTGYGDVVLPEPGRWREAD
jgi:hypothetical protein